jgi:M6 family metalloprotease-like protein
MKSIFTIVILAFSIQLISAPFNGKIMKFEQPDGSSVDVKLYGDEYYMRAEGLDNYTLIRDKITHWICYAVLSGDGSELVSTGNRYHGIAGVNSSLKSNLNIPEHIDISEKSRVNKITQKKGFLNGKYTDVTNRKSTPDVISGNIKGLCVVVDFSDEPGTIPISEFSNFCNNLNYTNYGNNGSLRKFYSDISGGLLDYQNVVFGYYRAPLTFEEYDQMPQSEGAPQILNWVLNKINSEGFDFSTLSTNPDGSIMAINLMYTGVPQVWADGLWWHQGYYPDFYADGVHSGTYNCSPAYSPLRLSTVAHENGHMIGKWPDTYKYTTDNGLDGIGTFDLMCYYGDDHNPVPPNPLFRSDAGWGNVVDVTKYNGPITDVANSLTCYKYQINNSDEFFLIESRRKSGRSSFIADEGLTIWHVDRLGDNQTTHHEIYLVHANNNIADHTQACFHSGFNNEYSLSTTPGSDFYNGDPSGLRIRNISAVSDAMTYNIGVAAAAPSLQLSYYSISGDNNGNGFLEPGESGNINVLAGNAGTIISGNSTIVCSALGSTAGYISINTPSVNKGVINVSQTVTSTHNVSIHSDTPVGTMIELRFSISDGTYTTYLTKKFVVGRQIFMDNQQIATCSSMFYDRGGPFSNYANMTDYITTISSPTLNQPIKVEFLNFELEDAQDCIYDYLKIYDGGSTSSPLLGTYCGKNSPGIIISTDPGGKLTFQFHSDTGSRYAGWNALVTCNGTILSSEKNLLGMVRIYPNPSKGIINIKMDTEINAEVSVTDISGKTVAHCVSSFNCNQMEIDLSDNPDGIYFVHLKTNREIITEKVIISK